MTGALTTSCDLTVSGIAHFVAISTFMFEAQPHVSLRFCVKVVDCFFKCTYLHLPQFSFVLILSLQWMD